MNALYAMMETLRPYVLSILRIVVGLLFPGSTGFRRCSAFPPPRSRAERPPILAALLETIGALLFLVGAYTRIVPLILSAKWPSPISLRMRRARFFPARQWRTIGDPVLLPIPLFRFCGRRPVERDRAKLNQT